MKMPSLLAIAADHVVIRALEHRQRELIQLLCQMQHDSEKELLESISSGTSGFVQYRSPCSPSPSYRRFDDLSEDAGNLPCENQSFQSPPQTVPSTEEHFENKACPKQSLGYLYGQ